MIQLSPQAAFAIEKLEQAGFEAYVVGGAVRDALRGAPTADWDLTTSALPTQTEAVFSGFPVVETGLKHGTVTVRISHVPLEITTFRCDGAYSDHRRPDSVRYTASLREDLARRDFTVNAMAWCARTGLVDPFGGQKDLKQGVIRCVGQAQTRFEEDALRILRALRFAARLDFAIEPQTAAAILEKKALLSRVSAERIQKELSGLLCGAAAERVLTDFAPVAAEVLPELRASFGFEQRNIHHNLGVWRHTLHAVSCVPPEPVLRWAALLHDVGKPRCFTLDEAGQGHFYGHAQLGAAMAEEILARLRFSGAWTQQILTLIRWHDVPVPADRKQLARLLRKLGEPGVRQFLALHRADTLAQAPCCRARLETCAAAERLLAQLLHENACVSLRELALNGHDLLALGLRGRAVGQALELCLQAVMDGAVPNEKPALLAFLREQNFLP